MSENSIKFKKKKLLTHHLLALAVSLQDVGDHGSPQPPIPYSF